MPSGFNVKPEGEFCLLQYAWRAAQVQVLGYLHGAHAARGTKGSYNRCCDTGNHLYDKL